MAWGRSGAEDPQISAYMAEGDQLGFLWKQGLFDGAATLAVS